jgi:hypothetical protein
MKPSKKLHQYPEVIKAAERLHLLTQVALGFPRGEHAALEIPAGRHIETAAWTYSAEAGHTILIGDTLPSHFKLLKGGSPSEPVTLRGMILAYQHERMHALFTGSKFKTITDALTTAKVPFRLWNCFEDVRIEHHGATQIKTLFRWSTAMPVAGPVKGDPLDPSSPLAFIIHCKQVMGEILAERHAAGCVTSTSGLRYMMNRKVFKGPWKDAVYLTPNGCTGNYDEARHLIYQIFSAATSLDLIPIMGEWLKLFPFPEGADTVPGETGAVAGIGEGAEDAEGTGTPDASKVRPGSFSEETVSSAVESAFAEIMAKEGATPAEIEKARETGIGHTSIDSAPYDPEAANIEKLDTSARGFITHTVPKPGCVQCYGGRNPASRSFPLEIMSEPVSECDMEGDDSAAHLRSAFPGERGVRFTANPSDDVNIDRYITRQPEMFQDRKGDNGHHADLILVIDGSSSMRGRWYCYGLSIVQGILKLRDQGVIKRVRLAVTGPNAVLLIEHPTAAHVDLIEPNAGYEGLWCAYEAIVAADWATDKTHVLVITDGDITDRRPDKELLHAGGCYPIGVYCNPKAGAASKIAKLGAYFDIFIERPNRHALLDEIGRLFV